MPLVYLDSNVIVSMIAGECAQLNSLLSELVDAGRIVVPYSATHLEELEGIHRSSDGSISSDVAARLRWLGEFTRNQYLYSGIDVKIPELRVVDPARVLSTINEVSWARSAMQGLATMISREQVENFRGATALDPNILNNVQPPGVLEKLELLLRPAFLAHAASGSAEFSLRAMIESATKLHRQGAQFGWMHEVAGVMSLLNVFGFWPDDCFTDRAWAASIADAGHVALAAYTDAFVTLDKRLRVKAWAVYEYYEVTARVFTPEAATDWLRTMR